MPANNLLAQVNQSGVELQQRQLTRTELNSKFLRKIKTSQWVLKFGRRFRRRRISLAF
jgi:hypothetical protein